MKDVDQGEFSFNKSLDTSFLMELFQGDFRLCGDGFPRNFKGFTGFGRSRSSIPGNRCKGTRQSCSQVQTLFGYVGLTKPWNCSAFEISCSLPGAMIPVSAFEA